MNASIKDELANAAMLLDVLSKTLESEGDESRYFLAKMIQDKLEESLRRLAG